MVQELLTRGRRVLRAALPALLSWLVVLAAALLVLIVPAPVAAWIGLAAVLLLWAADVFFDFPVAAAPLAGLTVALAAATAATHGWDWQLALSLAVLLILAFATTTIRTTLRPPVSSSGLPVTRPWFARLPEPSSAAACLGLILLAGALGGLLPVWALLAGVLVVAALAAGLVFVQLRHLRSHQPERALAAALTELAPRYLLYYAGPRQGAYQLSMWLPHLAEVGEPAALLVRDPDFVPAAARLGGLPVVQADSVEAMEYLMVSSLRAILYVNNDARNADGVRFAGLRHVFLGHGDSDKPSSWSAMSGIYDQIFVAGQAGIDRYRDHGVLIPEAKFVKVGRPQLAASLDVATGPLPAPRTVLYAPTWRGGLNDMQLGSLKQSVELVGVLLSLGAKVIFRPHPLSFRDAESRVLIGRVDALLQARPDAGLTSAQASALTIAECMNRSDALVADISSVVSDYLFTNKPFAVLVSPGKSALIADSLARAAIVVDLSEQFDARLAELLGPDVRAEARQAARSHYLGAGSGPEQQAVFVAAIRAALRTAQ